MSEISVNQAVSSTLVNNTECLMSSAIPIALASAASLTIASSQAEIAERREKHEVLYGIIGTGMMGVEHIRNLTALEGARLVAIADPHFSSQQAAISEAPSLIKVFDNHIDLLDSGFCDIVVVATPNMTHSKILLDILNHRRKHHILVEKPLCISVSECKQVINASQKKLDRLIQVGLEYRYMPPVARLITEVHGGSIGRVRMVSIREHRFPFLVKVNNWNRFSRNTGGTLVEKCCHFFDLMNLITCARPTRVMASGSQDVNHLDEEYHGEVPDILDNAYVVVDYDNGARGVLDLCMFAEGSQNEQEISVVGNLGKIEAFVPENVVRIGTRAGGRQGVRTIAVHDPRIKFEGLHHGSSFLEHLELMNLIRLDSEKAPKVSLEDGLLSVAIGEAAHKSIQLGRPVLLKEVLDS